MSQRTRLTLRAVAAVLLVPLFAFDVRDLLWLWSLAIGTFLLSYGTRIDRGSLLACYGPGLILGFCIATGSPVVPVLGGFLAGVVLFRTTR